MLYLDGCCRYELGFICNNTIEYGVMNTGPWLTIYVYRRNFVNQGIFCSLWLYLGIDGSRSSGSRIHCICQINNCLHEMTVESEQLSPTWRFLAGFGQYQVAKYFQEIEVDFESSSLFRRFSAGFVQYQTILSTRVSQSRTINYPLSRGDSQQRGHNTVSNPWTLRKSSRSITIFITKNLNWSSLP